MTNLINFAKLTEDLKAGLDLAKKAAAENGGEDNGTSNFDAPEFYFDDRAPSPKVRAQYEEACRAAGIRGFWTSDMFGRKANRRFVFGPGCGGQGNSRTRAAEAFAKHLTAQGYSNVDVYYQMD